MSDSHRDPINYICLVLLFSYDFVNRSGKIKRVILRQIANDSGRGRFFFPPLRELKCRD